MKNKKILTAVAVQTLRIWMSFDVQLHGVSCSMLINGQLQGLSDPYGPVDIPTSIALAISRGSMR